MNQRIAIVTGGSRGLGKNAVLKLAAQGTDIIFTYNSQRDAALQVVAEVELRHVALALPRLDCLAACLVRPRPE